MATTTRQIDATTGDRVMARARRTWARATTPELAIVQNVLRTPLGSAARDPSYGVEGVDNATANAAARWRQNVLVALSRWIRSGVLRDVDVTSDVLPLPGGGAALVYTVSFKGRDGRPQSFEGQR